MQNNGATERFMSTSTNTEAHSDLWRPSHLCVHTVRSSVLLFFEMRSFIHLWMCLIRWSFWTAMSFITGWPHTFVGVCFDTFPVPRLTWVCVFFYWHTCMVNCTTPLTGPFKTCLSRSDLHRQQLCSLLFRFGISTTVSSYCISISDIEPMCRMVLPWHRTCNKQQSPWCSQ